jgi:hypothetical protein
MNRRGAAAVMVGCALAATSAAVAGDTAYDIGGRVSPQVAVTSYPDNSVFRDIFGSSSTDSAIDARVVFGLQHDRWSCDADYQLVGVYGDRVEFTRELPEELRILFPHLPDDRTRLFDLTHVITDSGKTAALQRLDRLAVGHASDHLVMKFGRQAITWGNGLIYTVMDIFNPFDPAAVDKEYKTGDDMLYGQWLRANGDDLQGVMVFRRDPFSGEVEADQGSLALKYHHMASISEYDALVAQHYGDTLLGAGVNYSIGGAVWRGDLAVAFTDDDTVASLVTSLSQSWTWNGTNVSGVAEYFYNGFGQSDGCYSPVCLEENPELLKRVARGELFNLGQHYVAVSAMIEVHPLFLLTPNVFVNVTDLSVLLQVVFQNDLRENLMLWSAVALPVGADGTEFGGAEVGNTAPGEPPAVLSTGPSASVQLVWYW